MKIKNIKWTMMMVLAIVGLGFSSCEDEPDKYEITGGTPSINYIRPVDYASRDSLVVQASLGSSVCIVGNNLTSIKKILFNDVPAVLNTSYMTSNTILLTVPETLPQQVTDSLYMITGGNDTIAYPFKVVIPAPIISSMSDEHAVHGEEVTLVGNYFLDYAGENQDLRIMVGKDYQLPRENITSISQTAIKFTVPDNMPHDYISVRTIYGTTVAKFKYMDTTGMLFDFDTPWDGTNVLGNHGWHNQKILNDENSREGNYLMLGDADLTADAPWNDGNFSFEYWPGTWNNTFDADGPKLCDIADFSKWQNKALKFEMCIPEDHPWTSGPMQIIFSSTSAVTLPTANNTFFHDQGKLSRALYMPWNNDDMSYDTKGKWITVTIPFSEFNKDYDGNPLKSTFTSTEDFAGLTLFVVKGAYNDKSVIPNGKDGHPVIRIDNIRVVPYN